MDDKTREIMTDKEYADILGLEDVNAGDGDVSEEDIPSSDDELDENIEVNEDDEKKPQKKKNVKKNQRELEVGESSYGEDYSEERSIEFGGHQEEIPDRYENYFDYKEDDLGFSADHEITHWEERAESDGDSAFVHNNGGVESLSNSDSHEEGGERYEEIFEYKEDENVYQINVLETVVNSGVQENNPAPNTEYQSHSNEDGTIQQNVFLQQDVGVRDTYSSEVSFGDMNADGGSINYDGADDSWFKQNETTFDVPAGETFPEEYQKYNDTIRQDEIKQVEINEPYYSYQNGHNANLSEVSPRDKDEAMTYVSVGGGEQFVRSGRKTEETEPVIPVRNTVHSIDDNVALGGNVHHGEHFYGTDGVGAEYRAENRIENRSEYQEGAGVSTTNLTHKVEKTDQEHETSISDTHGIIEEAQTKEVEKKEENLHAFSQSVNYAAPLEMGGNTAIQYLKSTVKGADSNFSKGTTEIKKYVTPAVETAVIIGMQSSLMAELNSLSKEASAIGNTVDLIKNGKLSANDLTLTQGEIKGILRNIEGIKVSDIAGMAINASTTHDFLVFQNRMKQELGSNDLLKVHMESKDFFSLNNKNTNDILNKYFKKADSDVLRNVNVQGLSQKELKRLLKWGKKNGFSKTDESALRLKIRQKSIVEKRKKLGDKRIGLLKKHIKKIGNVIVRADENFSSGMNAFSKVSSVARGSFSVTRFGFRLWKKHTISGRLATKVANFTKAKAKQAAIHAGKGAVNAGKAIHRAAANSRVGKAAASVGQKATAPAVNAYKAAAKIASQAAKAISQTKAAQTAAAIARATGRVGAVAGRFLGTGAHLALTPFRAVNRLVQGFLNIAKKVAVVAGAIIIGDLLLISLIGGISSMFASVTEAASTVILTDEEDFISKASNRLQQYLDEQKAEAEAIGKGVPQNPVVFHSHTIDRYGHPSEDGWVDGYKFYYKDSDGNIKPSASNNIKDVLVLAYIMMDGDFDTNTSARDDLIDDLWSIMNPALTWEESSIYTCADGCDTFDYECDSESDYSEMDDMESEGVGFYGAIAAQTDEGCQSREIEETVDDGDGESHTVTRIEYYCDGHSVDVCYGHKDISIYFTTYYMQDMFDGKISMPNGSSYASYIAEFESFGGWNEDAIEWAKNLFGNNWYDAYGFDPVSAYGIGTTSSLSDEEVDALLSGVDMTDVSETRKQTVAFALSQVGQIPYYYGGKATSPDLPIQTNVGLAGGAASHADAKGRTTAGLDCYGFVQFVLWHVTGIKIPTVTCANFISNGGYGYKQITASELKPGDMGVQNGHTGMFVGYMDGKPTWVHCTGGGNTVVVNNYGGFTNFYRILD